MKELYERLVRAIEEGDRSLLSDDDLKVCAALVLVARGVSVVASIQGPCTRENPCAECRKSGTVPR